jgi:hypothetical protein
MSMVEVDELQLERVRTWSMYMECIFAPRSDEEHENRDEMREDWNKLYESMKKIPIRDIKVFKT